MSIQHKLQVADVYNRINRLKEEERLLYAEMKQFIVYFKETIPGRIKASIEGTYIYIGVMYMHVLTVILLLTAILNDQLFVQEFMNLSEEDSKVIQLYILVYVLVP